MCVAISFTTGDLRVFCTLLFQRGGYFARTSLDSNSMGRVIWCE
jgi:hypothetical protein